MHTWDHRQHSVHHKAHKEAYIWSWEEGEGIPIGIPGVYQGGYNPSFSPILRLKGSRKALILPHSQVYKALASQVCIPVYMPLWVCITVYMPPWVGM